MAVHQNEHDRKFDRQMRLWGAHGQRNLEEAHICVLGAGPAASETLKNLVLPNVGHFTLVDQFKVTVRDCGNNFFVTQDDVGKSRAEVVTKWLFEMNPDVNGTAVEKDPKEIIEKDIKFFDKFSCVIATQLFGESHTKLADYLFSKQIPYVSVRINGLMGFIRVAFPEITIIESHPTNDRTDFYIYHEQLKNFTELNDFIHSFNLKTDDVEKRAHLPCVAILGQFAQQWMKSHDGKLPSTFQEQQTFKEKIQEELGDGENVDDSIQWAFQCYNKPRIDRDVMEVLTDKKGEVLTKDSSHFWVCVRALRDFMENEGKGFLPVSTNIPDITADSKSYVTLKNIYKTRANKDKDIISGYVQKRLQEIGQQKDAISEDLIERFVKNCRDLKVVRTRSVGEEYSKPDMEHVQEQYIDWSALEEGKNEEDEEIEKPLDPKSINWYWAFRATDEFYNQHKRLPGISKDKIEADLQQLVSIQMDLFKQIDLEQDVVPECLQEICRFGGSEIHNIAAFMGGVASQAVMKIILKQFFEFNHTLLFNGIYCSASVVRP